MLQLRHAWADGTTHLAFTLTAFLERLAVLVPRPHVNLLRYDGVPVTRRVLRHLRLHTEVPTPAPPRAPPTDTDW